MLKKIASSSVSPTNMLSCCRPLRLITVSNTSGWRKKKFAEWYPPMLAPVETNLPSQPRLRMKGVTSLTM